MPKSPPSPLRKALTEAGFVPLPRLWVKVEEYLEIKKVAHKHQNEVNSIRAEINKRNGKPDPRDDRDAAWEAYEKSRS